MFRSRPSGWQGWPVGVPLRHPLGRLCGLLLLAVPLSGCGMLPWFGGDRDPTPPTPLQAPPPTEVTVTALWSVRPTQGSGGRRLALVPALGPGRFYVASQRGEVAAVSLDSGQVLWTQTIGAPFSGGPEASGEQLFLGTSQGEVVALATDDGRELWRARVGSEVLAVPRALPEDLAPGLLVVHTLDDSLHGLDRTTGDVRWRTPYAAPVLTLRGTSTPALAPSGIIAGLSGGRLVKLEAGSGEPLWEAIITRPSGRSELSRITDIDADPLVIGTLVFAATFNGDLAAVDLLTGTVLWRRQLSVHAGLAADQRDIVVTDARDLVWRADPLDGSGRWSQEALRHRQLSAPALLGELIAVGDSEGYLHLLARADGRLVGRTRITSRGAIRARPLVHEDRLYVLADDGTLTALVPSTLTPAAGIAPSADLAAAAAAP